MKEGKPTKISAQNSTLKIEQDLIRYHFSILVPDSELPFGVYIYFKGKYLEIIKRGQVVPLKLIASMFNENNYFFYILRAEKDIFDIWVKKRHIFDVLPKLNLEKENKIIDHRIGNYIKYAEDSLVYKEENIDNRNRAKDALHYLRCICQQSNLLWYFEQNIDDKIRNHTSRVIYSILLFLLDQNIELNEMDKELLAISSIIHELTENPEEFSENNASKITLDFLSDNQLALEEKLINKIKLQSEFVNGLGGPVGLKAEDLDTSARIFSLFNYFDHLRHSYNDLTRAKSVAKALEEIEEKKEYFCSDILNQFNTFIEKVELRN